MTTGNQEDDPLDFLDESISKSAQIEAAIQSEHWEDARVAIDTSGPMGRLFLTLIGAISALERDICRDRIRQGMARRRLMGLSCGRQPLDVDHDAIVADRLRGMSLTDVARRYSVSRASVVRWVRVARQSNPGLSASSESVHRFEEEVAA